MPSASCSKIPLALNAPASTWPGQAPPLSPSYPLLPSSPANNFLHRPLLPRIRRLPPAHTRHYSISPLFGAPLRSFRCLCPARPPFALAPIASTFASTLCNSRILHRFHRPCVPVLLSPLLFCFLFPTHQSLSSPPPPLSSQPSSTKSTGLVWTGGHPSRPVAHLHIVHRLLLFSPCLAFFILLQLLARPSPRLRRVTFSSHLTNPSAKANLSQAATRLSAIADVHHPSPGSLDDL